MQQFHALLLSFINKWWCNWKGTSRMTLLCKDFRTFFKEPGQLSDRIPAFNTTQKCCNFQTLYFICKKRIWSCLFLCNLIPFSLAGPASISQQLRLLSLLWDSQQRRNLSLLCILQRDGSLRGVTKPLWFINFQKQIFQEHKQLG